MQQLAGKGLGHSVVSFRVRMEKVRFFVVEVSFMGFVQREKPRDTVQVDYRYGPYICRFFYGLDIIIDIEP